MILRIRLVLFDLGGVIVFWNDVWLYQHVARKWNVQESILARECERLLPDLHSGRLDEHEYWNAVKKRLGIDVWHDTRESIIKPPFKEMARINTEILPILGSIRKNGVSLGVLSNTERMAFEVLEEQGVFDNFQHLFLSFRLGLVKPEPEIYLHVLGNVSYTASEILLIDDKKKNIEAAEGAGIKGMLFNDSKNLAAELKRQSVIL